MQMKMKMQMQMQMQVLHEYDSCCFAANGLHDEIKQYNAYVQGNVAGWMQTAVTAGGCHA